jgi:D-alanyl-D-alanine dipeptidase
MSKRPTNCSQLSVLALCFGASLAGLLAAPQGPPKDPKATRAADLVEIVKLDPTIKLDIRYASTNNFVGKPIYTRHGPFSSAPPPSPS